MTFYDNAWQPGKTTVQQVTTILIGSNTNTHTFVLKLAHPSGIGVAQTMTTITADGVLTTDQLASALQVAAAALNHEFAKAIAWTVSGSTVTATANIAGVPFVLTVTGTGTSTVTTTVANVGPNSWACAGNWSMGYVPVAGDTVRIGGNVSILYGLDQSGVTLSNLEIRNYSGTIGWLGMPLVVDVSTFLFIQCAGGTIHIAEYVSGTCAVCEIVQTGGSEPNYGVIFQGYQGNGCGTISLLRVLGGTIALNSGTFTTAFFGAGQIFLRGAAVTTFSINGATVTHDFSTSTTCNLDSGTLISEGNLSLTTLTQNGGYAAFHSTDITTYNLRGGTGDFSDSRVACTIGTMNVRQAARLIMDTAVVTVTTFTREGMFEYKGLDYGRAA